MNILFRRSESSDPLNFTQFRGRRHFRTISRIPAIPPTMHVADIRVWYQASHPLYAINETISSNAARNPSWNRNPKC